MATLPKRCIPIENGTPPLTRKECLELVREVPGWALSEGHLRRTVTFKDFKDAMQFVKELALLAQEEGHIPDICIRENRIVEISWYTYPSGGLTLNDFIMASRLESEIPTKS
jgi:4a-hydroxytetrahydrobiopterin dehydratase